MARLSAPRVWKGVGCALALGVAMMAAAGEDPTASSRRRMVQRIESMERNGVDVRRTVLEAMRRVPRHAFVPPSQRDFAYENRPLPIGYGQTISQPYIVALMTELADPDPGDRVLEIGTGSGYQAAVLSLLVAQVHSIEIVEPLHAQAAVRLRTYRNVRTRVGDGYYGWKEAGPFDAIVVTAAAPNVPPPLLAQLKPGGRMVIPVGTTFFTQQLLLVQKDKHGRVRTQGVLPVMFVPLTGDH